jgi:branched-chain amino acid transport system substrate-binding protein
VVRIIPKNEKEGGIGMRKMKSISVFTLVFFVTAALILSVSAPMAVAAPEGAPAELKVAYVDFLSGAAALFGMSTKVTTEYLVDKWNKEGGIRGVPIKVLILDEAGGAKKQVTEFRRMVLEEKVDAVVGYTSSANCLAIAPVAEELKTLTVAHICGTHRLTEDMDLKYTFRTSNNQASDSVVLARYLMKAKPNAKTVAAINDDYAWGRDSWETFIDAWQKLRSNAGMPPLEVKTTLWPKLQAGEYSAEISKLLMAKADVIHCSMWGGGLVSFVKQAAPRGLFKQSTVVLSTGESVLQDVKDAMGDGVVALPRLTAGYFLDPDSETDAEQKAYVEGYVKLSGGRYPDYPSYRCYQAWAGLKAAYEKAIDILGRWPTTEEVARAFEGLVYEVPGGTVVMRPDHQGVSAGLIGVTKMSDKYGFPILVDRVRISPEEMTPPYGVKTYDWLKTLK